MLSQLAPSLLQCTSAPAKSSKPAFFVLQVEMQFDWVDCASRKEEGPEPGDLTGRGPSRAGPQNSTKKGPYDFPLIEALFEGEMTDWQNPTYLSHSCHQGELQCVMHATARSVDCSWVRLCILSLPWRSGKCHGGRATARRWGGCYESMGIWWHGK